MKYRQMRILNIFLISAFITPNVFGLSLDELEKKLIKENIDLSLTDYKLQFDVESLQAAKGLMFPSLTINSGLTTGKDQGDTLNSFASSANQGVGSLPGLAGASSASSSQSVQMERDSWTADLSLNYIVFRVLI